jgi:hypothetical protein
MRMSMRFAVQICLVFTALVPFASSSAFGQGTNPFFTPPTFPGAGQMLSADVNGDGKPDLIFFDGTVLFGKGDGTFTTGKAWKNSTAMSSTVEQFAIADFNGDGKPDIFFTGPLNGLSVMLGNGDGTFQAPITTNVASPPSGFIVGDLNGDGKPDVLAQVGAATLTFLGNGDGTFAAGINSNAASPQMANAFADFNGDGKLDLLVPGSGIQLGNGDGSFQAPLPFPSEVLTASATVSDYDGNGKLDIFVTGGTSTSPEIQVLFGNGDGTFNAASPQSVSANAGISSPVAIDLNGDGKSDIVGSTGSGVQLFISKGDGTFTLSTYYNAPSQAGPSTPNMVVADFNGDRKLDVAAFNTMLLGNGDGTLQGNSAVPGAFGFDAIGDFNGDGHQDFAATGPVEQSSTNPNVYRASLNIWLNDGKNNFTLAHSYPISIPSPNVADQIALAGFTIAADLNGDGKADLVGYLADASGISMIVALGNGDGSFGAPISTHVTSTGNRLVELGFALGDVNGDGKPDLVVNAGNGPIPEILYVFLGNGDGTFETASTPFVGGSIGAPVVGDFNNDEKMDVITGSVNGLAVLLGNGDGTFQPTSFITNASCGTACGTPVSADFNADGKLDLMLAAVGGYQVLLGKGDGTFNILPAVTAGTFSGFFQVGDFNGDGKLDVLGSIGGTMNPLGLILGNGDGTFGSPLPVTNAGYPFVTDFNGDGKLDILEVGANQLVWLFNSGQAVPPPPPDFSIGAGSGGGTATVSAGSAAAYPLSLASSGGFTGSVALTCSVAPAGPVCSVSPSSVMVSGSTAVTATVSVTTTARSMLLPIGVPNNRDSYRKLLWIFGLFLASGGIVFLLASTRVHPHRLSWSLATICGAIFLFSAILVSGCGGSNSSSGSNGSTGTGTTAGNYTVTVSAQSGSVTHQTQLTLTVQ